MPRLDSGGDFMAAKMQYIKPEERGDEDDLSIYSDFVRQEMLECDGIDAAEEGFMDGYESAVY